MEGAGFCNDRQIVKSKKKKPIISDKKTTQETKTKTKHRQFILFSGIEEVVAVGLVGSDLGGVEELMGGRSRVK